MCRILNTCQGADSAGHGLRAEEAHNKCQQLTAQKAPHPARNTLLSASLHSNFFSMDTIDEAIDRHPVSPSTLLVTLILCRRSACTDPPVVFKFSPKEEKNCYKSGPLFLISYKALAWFSRILALTKSLQTVINYKFKCDYKMGVTKNRRIQTFVLYKSFDSLHCIDWLLSIKAIQPFIV